MNFEACLALAHDPREATVIADNLEALGRALRDWPEDTWSKLAATGAKTDGGLFERLAARTAQSALNSKQRTQAAQSAEAVVDVLRVLWPEATPSRIEPTAPSQADERLLTSA